MPSLCFSPRGCVFSHGMHGTHRSLGCVFSPRTHLGGYGILPYPRRPLNNSPTDGTDAHRWFGCVGFSHGIHRIHRNFWRRRASHGFRRCPQMVRLRRVLWEDSLVVAWVWQGCHTLLICAHLCNLWENILRQKFFVFCGRIVMLVHDCFVGTAETAAPPLVGCKKCIDFFVVTKFRCIFAM